jgi:hypothetical protein
MAIKEDLRWSCQQSPSAPKQCKGSCILCVIPSTNCRDQRRWIWGRLQKTADQEHIKSVKRASSALIALMRVGTVCSPRLFFTRPLPLVPASRVLLSP